MAKRASRKEGAWGGCGLRPVAGRGGSGSMRLSRHCEGLDDLDEGSDVYNDEDLMEVHHGALMHDNLSTGSEGHACASIGGSAL